MSEPEVEEAVERIKALGVIRDEQEIRQALEQCNNNAEVSGGGLARVMCTCCELNVAVLWGVRGGRRGKGGGGKRWEGRGER